MQQRMWYRWNSDAISISIRCKWKLVTLCVVLHLCFYGWWNDASFLCSDLMGTIAVPRVIVATKWILRRYYYYRIARLVGWRHIPFQWGSFHRMGLRLAGQWTLHMMIYYFTCAVGGLRVSICSSCFHQPINLINQHPIHDGRSLLAFVPLRNIRVYRIRRT